MLAVVCSSFGEIDDLSVSEVARPKIQPGSVRINVSACGLNYPDALLVQGKYQHKPELPFFPGGEISGVVTELADDVSGWRVGDRVMATTFWNGLVEEVIVPAAALCRVPDSMDMLQAAVFQGAYNTSYFALKQRAHLQAGETLLVLGASGGVGLAAMKLGRLMGARVIGAVGSSSKADLLRSMGFEEVINYSESDLRDGIKKLTHGEGIDVVYDPVGGDYFEQAARSLRLNGRMLVVGFASGSIPTFPVNLSLLKQTSVVGVNYHAFYQASPKAAAENLSQLCEFFVEGKITSHIDAIYPLEDAKIGLKRLDDRSIVGKVVVTMPGYSGS